MFKFLVIPALATFAGYTQTVTNLNLYRYETKVGSGKYTETKSGHGNRTSTFEIQSSDDGGTSIHIKQVKVIDTRAFPISEEEDMTEISAGPKPHVLRKIKLKVRYDDSGAAVLSKFEEGSWTERTFVPIPGYSRADASDLWFSKVIPKAGTTVSSTVFDIENAKWQVIKTTYVGKKWISIGGRQLETNEVQDVRDGGLRQVYLDNKGQPVLMINREMRTEKKF